MAKIVLLVDDNAMNRKLFSALLSRGGFECVMAEDGEQATVLAKLHKPDIILMDIQMPHMDGVSSMKAIRAEPGLASIPIIALTSYAMSGDKEMFLADGFTSYIPKPVDTRTFASLVQQVLDHA